MNNKQVVNLHKTFFVSYLSTDIKLSSSQLSRMIQSGGFLGRLLCVLRKTGLPVTKNVIQALAKSILTPLKLTAAAADTGIFKKIMGSGTTALMISNDEMEEIIKIVKSIEDSGLLLKGVSETIQNEAKGRKGFLSTLLGALDASLLIRKYVSM